MDKLEGYQEHTISIEKDALEEIRSLKEGKKEFIEQKRRMFNMLDTINGDFDVFDGSND